MEWTGVTLICLKIALLAFFWPSFDSSPDQDWEQWKKKHNKKHHTKEEEIGRRALWDEIRKQIDRHNQEEREGKHTYTVDINYFSDLTKEEIQKIFIPLKIPKNLKLTAPPQKAGFQIPDTLDWRDHKCVTKVKNQSPEHHDCGSCWAFSAVGALEGLLARTTGRLVDLSAQNLVDCSGGKYENFGCDGGFPHKAFDYVLANQGIDSAASYPYKAEDGSCQHSQSNRIKLNSTYYFVPKDEQSLKLAVAVSGPIAIGLDADEIQSYSSGVFNGNCGKVLNHAVLLVGYGTDKKSGLDYWLIKNSWGDTWGEDGYLRLARNHGQKCGISTYAVALLVEEDFQGSWGWLYMSLLGVGSILGYRYMGSKAQKTKSG